MAAKSKSLRSTLVNAALVVVGFALLGLAVWSNREKLAQVFAHRVDFGLFGLAFVIYVVALVCTFVRWFTLVRALDLPFRLLDAIKLGFIGNIFNLVIPGAVGGDVIKAVFLARAHPTRKAKAVASMVIDRLLGLAGLFVLAGVAAAFAFGRANDQVKILIGIVWALLACGLTGLFVLFQPRLYPLLDRLTGGRPKLVKILKELESAAGAYRSNAKLVVACLIASACIHSIYVVAFYVASRAVFDQIPSFGEHFLIVPLVLFSTAVPLPFGALGLTEIVSGRLFALGLTGDAATDAVANGTIAMMAFRTVMYASGLLGLIIYLTNLRWVRELTSPNAAAELASNTNEDALTVEPDAHKPEHAEHGD